jgi:hypothetical protein
MISKANTGSTTRTYPAARTPRHVQEYEHKAAPKASKQPNGAQDKSHHDAWRHQIAQRLALQEARKGISIHCLKDVVFGSVKHFGIISSILLNLLGDFVDDGLGEDDLSLSARQEICVEDPLGGSAHVLAIDAVVGAAGASRLLLACGWGARGGGEIAGPRGMGARGRGVMGVVAGLAVGVRMTMGASSVISEDGGYAIVRYGSLLRRASGGRVQFCYFSSGTRRSLARPLVFRCVGKHRAA